jgi:O-succinylhomoserine sulfhydrylase
VSGKQQDWHEFGFRTRAIRAGHERTAEGEQAEPIFVTSSFVFKSAAEAAARFAGDDPGNVYSRYTNPTVRIFEQRLALLEGGERCVATASGMSAILAICMALLKAGDEIVAARTLFGATISLFQNILARFGVRTTFLSPTDIDAWRQAITPKTRLLFIETPSNPVTEVADIAALAELAHAHKCILVVDNCFCTPALQQPLRLGADIVVHSATKYLDGQGRCLGGAVIGSEALVGGDVFGFLRTAGPTMSPFNAWVFLKGLETLDLRMKAHSDNAQTLATWLEARPGVKRVYFPGLPSHPQHALAARQQKAPGGLLSFDVAGGREQAWRFIDATELVSKTANLGDTKTMITHPASTTHGRMPPDARAAAGIGEGLIRIAVGLEDIEDIKRDLQRGFDAIR